MLYLKSMKIKKIGHCCLLIEIGGVKILTDPGLFTIDGHQGLKSIDIILITHEHRDHLHVDSLKNIVANNPKVKIITNQAVGKLVGGAGIAYEILEGKDSKTILDIMIEAHDAKHAEIFEDFGQVQNTGYFIDDKLFYPGDAYGEPGKKVSVLALPVAGPWCRIGDAIKYALKLKPEHAFPVHDGLIQPDKVGIYHRTPEKILKNNGIKFTHMIDGDELEF